MADVDMHALLEQISEVAAEAGERILEVYNTEFEVDTKSDASPLTAADLTANGFITAALEALEPRYPILSEESSKASYETRRTWHRYWLVDPLDGTREFVKRNGEFTVNIALIESGVPILGVVYVPVTGVCYAAARGVGAFKTDDADVKRDIRVKPEASGKLTVVGSRSHSNAATEAFVGRLGEVDMISIGSSLKICMVAEGRADIYPRIGPTSEWDTAAAHCIVEQAGGRLTDLSLRTLKYNAKESVLNPFFLVFGDSSYDWGQHLEDA